MMNLPPVAAIVIVQESEGGVVPEFQARIAAYRKARSVVQINGECASACTMLLGLPRVCATDKASFGFHQAYDVPETRAAHPSMFDVFNRNEAGTKLLWRTYPAKVRAWITRQGGLTWRMVFLNGPEMAKIVPSCGQKAKL